MPLCSTCGKTLSSPRGLRRHANTQHLQSEWHYCTCGKRFLDPAARSRCRTGHLQSFGCPIWGCDYRSTRKDAAKEHLKRRHRGSGGVEVLTLPPTLGPSESQSSNASPESNHTPSLELGPTAPSDFQPQSEVTHASLFHPDLPYSQSSPSS